MGSHEVDQRGKTENKKDAYPVIHLEGEQFTALVTDNPAIKIISDDVINNTFGKDAHLFTPELFNPVHVVRVTTAEGERTLLKDGHHRTGTFYAHQDKIKEKFPDFRFPVQDMTNLWLKEPTIASLRDTNDNAETLTMEQYLLIVINTTIGHKDIAPQRMAAHLMVGWESMIGKELADKFSGLAALNYLEKIQNRHTIGNRLDDYLQQQQTFFAGNTPPQQVKVRKALKDMHRIIQKTNIAKESIAQAAFELIGKQSSTIGGPEKTRQQIFGLLYHPIIQEKLAAKYGGGAEFTKQTRLLGEELLTALARLPKASERGILHQALFDHRLTIPEVKTIIASEKPQVEYTQVDLASQIRIVRENYLRMREKNRLTEREEGIINHAGFVRTAGKKGGVTIDGAVGQVTLLVNSFNKIDEIKDYLSGLENLPDKLLHDFKSRVSDVELKVKHASNVGARVGSGIQVDNLFKEIKDTVQAYRETGSEKDTEPEKKASARTWEGRTEEQQNIFNVRGAATRIERTVFRWKEDPKSIPPEMLIELQRAKRALQDFPDEDPTE